MYLVTQPPHLDDWTLLRHVVKDLEAAEQESIQAHLASCDRCSRGLREISGLDQELRELAAEWDELDEQDAFARRPEKWEPHPHLPPHEAERVMALALAASEQGLAESEALLAAVTEGPAELSVAIERLSLTSPASRFALLYALETVAQGIADGPTRAHLFAERILGRLELERPGRSQADRLVPIAVLSAHARLLAGQAGNWTGKFDESGAHLAEAYRLFGESAADLFSLAVVEMHESQRRSFAGNPREGLALARRARRAFESLAVDDYVARAQAVEGNALYFLGRPQEALSLFLEARSAFEEGGLWSNYVGVINSMSECLLKLGEPEEARRQYARALRRVSREKQPAWTAFIRHGLANAMFSACRYREAAVAFGRAARLHRELGFLANMLTADLYEVESWARAGDRGRATHRFELWREQVALYGGLDPSLARSLETALTRDDLTAIATLRQEAEGILREQLKEKRIS